MRTKQFKTLVSVFFILLFLSSKVSLFHNLTHDHEHEHALEFGHINDLEPEHKDEHKQDSNSSQCEICIQFIANQFTPTNAEAEDATDIIDYGTFINKVVAVTENKIFSKIDKNSLYTRPPPFC